MTTQRQKFESTPYLDKIRGARRFETLGKVSRVLGLVVEASLPDAPIGAICDVFTEDDNKKRQAEVIGLKENHVQMMMIGDVAGVRIGSHVKVVQNRARVKVGKKLLGRVINPDGSEMDNAGKIQYESEYPLYQSPIAAMGRKRVQTPVSLGVRAIDSLMTCAEGQRVAIMSGSGVGKSTLLGMMARYTESDINVIALLGERAREVRDFIEKDLGEEGLRRSVVVVATSDTPPLIRMRCAFVATAIAEYFRDRGSKVLLLMDSLTRFSMATREVGLSVGEPPTSRGYTPSTFTTLPKLLERAGTTAHQGSITGFYTILTEGDDINDPIADCVRSITDGHIVLSRKLSNEGHYPSIDVLNSLSRVMIDVTDEGHQTNARKVRALLANYTEMEDYINIGAYIPGKNSELDEAVKKIRHIKQFLRQDITEKSGFAETQTWLRQLAQ
ncbi:MAG: FliI/YscN family ATPase [Deltaproteobacteria bacterium]|nr:FliI/YscN family ATPase [Deltaproteobacteria bacterium]